MKQLFISLTVALLVFATGAQAQEGKSTKRIEKQHKATEHMAANLPLSEKTAISTLEKGTPEMQAQAVQAIRDLEQLFPDYPFASLVEPLGNKLKNKDTDPVVRRLAALALDELHSDAGDEFIKEVAASSDDPGLRILCKALLVHTLTE